MIIEHVKKTIENAIPGATAHIFDPNNDGQHLQAIVVCKDFEGLPLVKQHQLVMKPLMQAFAESVHALALKTMTPVQWEEFQKKYNVQ